MALVAFVLATVAGAIETSGQTAVHSHHRYVEADGQITFRQFLRTDIADEGEAVAVLEVGLSDDVAFEPWSRGNGDAGRTAARNTATVKQGEDKLRARRKRRLSSVRCWCGPVPLCIP